MKKTEEPAIDSKSAKKNAEEIVVPPFTPAPSFAPAPSSTFAPVTAETTGPLLAPIDRAALAAKLDGMEIAIGGTVSAAVVRTIGEVSAALKATVS